MKRYWPIYCLPLCVLTGFLIPANWMRIREAPAQDISLTREVHDDAEAISAIVSRTNGVPSAFLIPTNCNYRGTRVAFAKEPETLVVARTVSLQKQIDAADGRLRIPAGHYRLKPGIEIPHTFVLEGDGSGNTVLIFETEPGKTKQHFIVSKDWKQHMDNNAKWSTDSLPQLITLRGLTVHGDARINNGGTNKDEFEATGDGIHLFAGGVTLEDIIVTQIAGNGIVLTRGGKPISGWYQHTDWTEPTIRNVKVSACKETGLLVALSDAIVENYTAKVCGVGLQANGGGTNIGIAHVYGCDVGFQFDGLTYANNLQPENCGVGLTANAVTQIGIFRGFANRTTDIVANASIQCPNVLISTMQGTTGIRLNQKATGSRITGKINLAPNSIGVKCAAKKAHLDLSTWGGKYAVDVTGTRGSTICVEGGNNEATVYASKWLGANRNKITVLHEGKGKALGGALTSQSKGVEVR